MKNNFLNELGGKICNTCKYYDCMNGTCPKVKGLHHHLDDGCEKWKIADDLVQHRDHKNKKKSENIKLFY